MTAPADSHHRPSSHHKKRPSANRPSILTRSQSANKVSVQITNENDGDEAMSSGFLQYCATCDKQILGNATLYCSERCRQKDNAVSPNYPLYRSDISTPTTPFSSLSLEPSFPSADIIPQRSPTSHRHSQPFFTSSQVDQAAAEVEAAHEQAASGRPSYERTDSEAARYLRQFGSSDRTYTRHRHARSSPNTSAAPSLSNTPASSYTASSANTPASLNSRPLPPRNNPWRSSASFSSRSADLVTPIPHVSADPSSIDSTGGDSDRTITSPTLCSPPVTKTNPVGAAAGILSYEKRTTIPGHGTSPGHSSLKQLFSF